MNFNHWLIMQLSRRNINQKDFAEELGFHRQTVVKWLGDNNYPKASNIKLLANYLARTEPEPWTESTKQLKDDYIKMIVNLCDPDVLHCPCCGAEVATVSRAG